MKIIETIALISINDTLFVQLGSFLLFLFLFNRLMIRPMRKAMFERETFFEQLSEEISAAGRSYDELARQIRREESAARKEAFKMREQLESEGENAASQLIARTREDINALRSKALQENEAQLTEARKQIKDEAEGIAEKIVASLLNQRSAA